MTEETVLRLGCDAKRHIIANRVHYGVAMYRSCCVVPCHAQIRGDSGIATFTCAPCRRLESGFLVGFVSYRERRLGKMMPDYFLGNIKRGISTPVD